MDLKTFLLTELLDCRYADIESLIHLLLSNKVRLNMKDIKKTYSTITVDKLKFEMLKVIVNRFLSENKDEIKIIVWAEKIDNYLSNKDFCEINGNLFGGYVKFKNKEIQKLFDNQGYRI